MGRRSSKRSTKGRRSRSRRVSNRQSGGMMIDECRQKYVTQIETLQAEANAAVDDAKKLLLQMKTYSPEDTAYRAFEDHARKRLLDKKAILRRIQWYQNMLQDLDQIAINNAQQGGGLCLTKPLSEDGEVKTDEDIIATMKQNRKRIDHILTGQPPQNEPTDEELERELADLTAEVFAENRTTF